MTREEFAKALRSATKVFVAVPCTGTKANVERGQADDAQYFAVAKSEARRVLLDNQDADIAIIAIVHESGALYIG
jgi:hypothetical protein